MLFALVYGTMPAWSTRYLSRSVQCWIAAGASLRCSSSPCVMRRSVSRLQVCVEFLKLARLPVSPSRRGEESNDASQALGPMNASSEATEFRLATEIVFGLLLRCSTPAEG